MSDSTKNKQQKKDDMVDSIAIICIISIIVIGVAFWLHSMPT